MKQKTRRSSATLSDILGHMKMKEFGRHELDQELQLLSPTGQMVPMSESSPMLYIPSQNDLSSSDRTSLLNSLHIPRHITNNGLLKNQRISASYTQLPSFYNPCYDNLMEGSINANNQGENMFPDNKKERSWIDFYGTNNNIKKTKVQKVLYPHTKIL